MRNKAPEIRILTIRDQKVVLDSDLARIYGVPTRVLNQALSRNKRRFPLDFAFRLSVEEYEAMRSQIVIASFKCREYPITSCDRIDWSCEAVATCDRIPAEYPVSSVGVHRTRRSSGGEYPAKRSGNRDERLRDPRVYRTAGKPGGECGHSEATS
jgi:ORF6N domain